MGDLYEFNDKFVESPLISLFPYELELSKWIYEFFILWKKGERGLAVTTPSNYGHNYITAHREFNDWIVMWVEP